MHVLSGHLKEPIRLQLRFCKIRREGSVGGHAQMSQPYGHVSASRKM